MRVVIMGCGRTGSILALLMSGAGHEVTVIESSQDAIRRLGQHHTCRIVMGNGLDEDVLKRADIESADAFVACTSGDNSNLMVTQLVRELYKVNRVGAKVNDPVRAEAYRQHGIFTITPGALTAGLLRDWIVGAPPKTIDQYNLFYPELQDLMKE
ncbi:MAG: TrkA family potassium uptake protein [Fimbriimonadia bacterium]|nr:TrkA family potassium uptake protein [Fimbriimonadia bacterium]